VLKPATLLYSFGSSCDEEPLGCVDVESFDSCDCTDLEGDGSIVIELLRQSGQTLKLKAQDAGWFACLKNETYSSLREASAILRKQRDEFALDITRLEDVAREARATADAATNAKNRLERKFGKFVDSLTTTLSAASSPTCEFLPCHRQQFGMLRMIGKDDAVATAVQRLVDQLGALEAAFGAVERQCVLDKDALSAAAAAIAAALAGEQRTNRNVKLANEKLNSAVLHLKKQRKTLCMVLKRKCKKRFNTKTARQDSTLSLRQRANFGFSTGSQKQKPSSDHAPQEDCVLDLKRKFRHVGKYQKVDGERYDKPISKTTITALSSVVSVEPPSHVATSANKRSLSRRGNFRRAVKEATLATMRLSEAVESSVSLRSIDCAACCKTNAQANANSVTTEAQGETDVDDFNAWLDREADNESHCLRITFFHDRLGVTFAPTVNGEIKVARLTSDYKPELPRPPPDSSLVAVNGQPLVVDDAAANFHILKTAGRPLVLDFRINK